MKLLCIGDCGVDHYVDRDLIRPGGITLNFAINARRFFAADDHIAIATPIADDPEAAIVESALAQAGLTGELRRQVGTTPRQKIRLGRDGEKEFIGYDEGVLAGFEVDARLRQLMAQTDWVITPVFSQIEQLFGEIITVESPARKAVDFMDLTDAANPLAFVERFVAEIDVGFFGLSAHEQPLIEALGALAKRTKKLFVVTLAADGSVAFAGEDRARCQARPVEQIVDTTGAGDTFAAAFLSRHLHGARLAEALGYASDRAAESLTHIGAFK